MPLNLNDPRIRKTRKALQAAFVRLILKEGYDAISIQSIADEADTARITFYRHYHDKQALLTDCLNTLYDELVQKTQRLTAEGLLGGYSPVLVLYEHIEEQETLYRLLFSGRGTPTVIERMRHAIATHALANIHQYLQNYPSDLASKVPLELLANHVASAQVGLAMWWLEQNKPYPAVYMAQMSLWFTLTGVLNTFGITEFKPPLPEMGASGKV